ncbi:endonuclease domain-containing protein [Mesorhizobium australicum]|uniref:endonuclease domain-containing protein n=1 Tax=Mesorhizobium australicum TaxID=536018 RepID=UPI003339DC93
MDDVSYRTLPRAPLAVDWTSVPELIRVAMLDLGGVQPVTKAMAEAAGGTLHDKPSAAEITLFQTRKTTFQMVSVVASCVAAGASNGVLQVKPFSITLVPASKRGEVDERSIDAIASLNVDGWLASQPMYTRYDPFSGGSGMYGNMPGYLDGQREGFLDEIGIVVDQYFLATATPEDDEILTMDLRMPNEDMRTRYERHRKNLLFRPFKKIETRRVWGVETPRELFLVQALAKENLFPQCQMFIMEDGAVFPSWYHLWQDVEFRHSIQPVTEADLFFPEERLAVFCDGAHHARGKNKARDAAINARLEKVGIQPLRILATEINFDLNTAVKRVQEALR